MGRPRRCRVCYFGTIATESITGMKRGTVMLLTAPRRKLSRRQRNIAGRPQIISAPADPFANFPNFYGLNDAARSLPLWKS